MNRVSKNLYSTSLHFIFDLITDFICFFSIIGIWPRFIESQRIHLDTKEIKLPIHPDLNGLRLLHLSDLHINPRLSNRFLKRLKKFITDADADIICFTGDFLSYSHCYNWQKLKDILISFKAKHAVFAVLGNHDYETYVSLENHKVTSVPRPKPFLLRALAKLFHKETQSVTLNSSHSSLKPLPKLKVLLQELGIELLCNESKTLKINNQEITFVGLEDLWTKGLDLKKAKILTEGHRVKIVLNHNPQAWSHLKKGDNQLILSGHTHGGNVRLPFLINKLQNIDDKNLMCGWVTHKSNFIHISKGLSSPYPFRLFCTPHMTSITLKSSTKAGSDD